MNKKKICIILASFHSDMLIFYRGKKINVDMAQLRLEAILKIEKDELEEVEEEARYRALIVY